MRGKRRWDAKGRALRAHGTLNPRPEGVTDPLFATDPFFDPRDFVQVKYEMLRRVHADGQPVRHASSAVGLSRPSFYYAQACLARDGLNGLVPKKRGPRGGHKVTAEVLAFVYDRQARNDALRAPQLAHLVRERFHIGVHPRSIERALARQEKKRR